MATRLQFITAINRVLSSEGGYANDPNDPGGETNWGISKRSYPNVDIKNLTRAEAIEIYKRDFWDPVAVCGGVPDSVLFQALDFSVNSSPATAIRKLQVCVGVADDGHWGPHSAEMAKQVPEPILLMMYISIRLKYMASLKNWPSFSRGWAIRMADNMLYGAEDLL